MSAARCSMNAAHLPAPPTAGVLVLGWLCREEGEKLSRKNGELEAAARKVRAQLRDSEAGREKLAARAAKAEAQAAQAAARAKQAEAEAAEAGAAAAEEVQRLRRAAEAEVAAVREEVSQAAQDSHQEKERCESCAVHGWRPSSRLPHTQHSPPPLTPRAVQGGVRGAGGGAGARGRRRAGAGRAARRG